MAEHGEPQQVTPPSSTPSSKRSPAADPFAGFPDPTNMPAAAYLEALCIKMTRYLNDHTMSDYKIVMEKYLSPKFKYEAEGPNAFLNANSRDEYYQNLVNLTKDAPDLEVAPVDCLSDVDEIRGKATLRSSSRIKAVFDTSSMIVRDCVEVTRWSRMADGEWVCDRLTLMTGPGSGSFDV